jgi:hypothetical protein
MTTIYIVTGDVGEYSDRKTWVVPHAFRDEEQAKAHVAELDEEGARILSIIDYFHCVDVDGVVEGEGKDGVDVKLPTKLVKLDSRFRMYMGRELPSYSVEAIELNDAVDDFLTRAGAR